MHQQQGDGRRRHAGNASSLPDGLWPLGDELLPHLVREAGDLRVVQISRNRCGLLLGHALHFELLPIDVALVLDLDLDLLSYARICLNLGKLLRHQACQLGQRDIRTLQKIMK